MAVARSARPMLSKEFVDARRRERLAQTVAECAQKHGLHGVTTSRIVQRARIGRNTFYETFESRDACVESACEMATARLTKPLAAAAAEDGTRGERAERTVDALIGAVCADPVMAELCLVHSPGSAALGAHRFRDAVVEATWQALGGDRMAELAAGAIVTLVEMRLRQGAAAGLPDLRKGLIGMAGG